MPKTQSVEEASQEHTLKQGIKEERIDWERERIKYKKEEEGTQRDEKRERKNWEKMYWQREGERVKEGEPRNEEISF